MGLYVKQEQPGHIWGIWKIEETPEELLEKLERKELYQSFLNKVTSEKRKKEWLAVRVLLKELTGAEKEINYRPTGAPYLNDSSWFISISHTKGYIAVSIKKDDTTGIDVEYYSERVKKIRSRFLSPIELNTVPPELETNHLLVCWCAKETLFKLIDREEVDFREHLHIEPFQIENSGSIHTYETRTPKRGKYTIHYITTPDFTLTYY